MVTPLKKARTQRKLTLWAVAAAVGVQGPTISRIENGKKKPSPELAARIANYFGAPLTRDQILFPEDYLQKAS